jgi:pullulanase/glycogen debranching enzyme
MSFKDKNFAARYGDMGDLSEGAFEQWCQDNNLNYIRWGLDRPPLNLRMLPTRLRYSPDYLTSNSFVECQGFGRDNVFKLKIEKHGALHWWADLHPVQLWILDSHKSKACFMPLNALDNLLPHAELHAFPEGKPYFAISGDVIFDAAGEVYAAQT